MTTMTINWNARPVGKRVRKAAQAHRATLNRLREARIWAVDDLIAHARARAIPRHMPTGLHTVRGLPDRAREWALNLAAKVVARSIERQTFKAAFDRLEAAKVGGLVWEKGVWQFICVMKGTVLP